MFNLKVLNPSIFLHILSKYNHKIQHILLECCFRYNTKYHVMVGVEAILATKEAKPTCDKKAPLSDETQTRNKAIINTHAHQ